MSGTLELGIEKTVTCVLHAISLSHYFFLSNSRALGYKKGLKTTRGKYEKGGWGTGMVGFFLHISQKCIECNDSRHRYVGHKKVVFFEALRISGKVIGGLSNG